MPFAPRKQQNFRGAKGYSDQISPVNLTQNLYNVKFVAAMIALQKTGGIRLPLACEHLFIFTGAAIA
jgi:hypothetical protein